MHSRISIVIKVGEEKREINCQRTITHAPTKIQHKSLIPNRNEQQQQQQQRHRINYAYKMLHGNEYQRYKQKLERLQHKVKKR